MYYRRVYTGTYRYVPICTAINQVYRIADAGDLLREETWASAE
jgi:hypothetical protein